MNKCGVRQLLDAALQGYASTVMAYGQTGSGKTFTMTGREELVEAPQYAGSGSKAIWDDAGATAPDGLLTRSLVHLYARMAKAQPGTRCVLRLSYLEIYNEHIFDLLNPSATPLQARAAPRCAQADGSCVAAHARSRRVRRRRCGGTCDAGSTSRT